MKEEKRKVCPFSSKGFGGEYKCREWTNSYGYGLRAMYGMCKQNVWACMKDWNGLLHCIVYLDRY